MNVQAISVVSSLANEAGSMVRSILSIFTDWVSEISVLYAASYILSNVSGRFVMVIWKEPMKWFY